MYSKYLNLSELDDLISSIAKRSLPGFELPLRHIDKRDNCMKIRNGKYAIHKGNEYLFGELEKPYY
jgi:hypothetical protein